MDIYIYIYMCFLRGTSDEHVTDLYGNIGYVWKYKGMYRNVRDHKEYSQKYNINMSWKLKNTYIYMEI